LLKDFLIPDLKQAAIGTVSYWNFQMKNLKTKEEIKHHPYSMHKTFNPSTTDQGPN